MQGTRFSQASCNMNSQTSEERAKCKTCWKTLKTSPKWTQARGGRNPHAEWHIAPGRAEEGDGSLPPTLHPKAPRGAQRQGKHQPLLAQQLVKAALLMAFVKY